jgi:cytochrome b subunit of formate dehydrogenase
MQSAISYQIIAGSFYGESCSWILESVDGALAKKHGPYWSREAAEGQIRAFSNWEAV